MGLKTETITRKIPDSPGWYWYRKHKQDDWVPTRVYFVPASGPRTVKANLVGRQKVLSVSNGTSEYPLDVFPGEWGPEIIPPDRMDAPE
jgi:hypothetical protein